MSSYYRKLDFFKKVNFCCGDRCLLCFWFRKVEILKFFRVFCAKREILELKHYVQDQTKPLTAQNPTFYTTRTTPQNVCPVHRFGTKLLKRLQSNTDLVFYWNIWWPMRKGDTTKSCWKYKNIEIFFKAILPWQHFYFLENHTV